MTTGSTPEPFRHLVRGEPCPVQPLEACPLDVHHRPRHCEPIPAVVGHNARSLTHRPKRARVDVRPDGLSFGYSTTEARGVTR